MDFVKKLPLAAKIAIPAALVLAIVGILMLTMRTPEMVPVVSTSDVDVLDASKKTLQAAKVPFDEGRDETTGEFTLEVLPEHETDATSTLQGSGLETRTDLAKPIECPNEPGFTGTRATQERYDNCQSAKYVQNLILATGALAANVIVRDVETGSLSGASKEYNTVAQVFLRTSQKDSFPAADLAQAISKATGSSIERVHIMSDKGHTLYGSDGSSPGEGTGSSRTGGGDCSNLSGFEDIVQKEAAVRRCYEQVISEKLTKVLGGEDRFEIAAQVDIDSQQTTETATRTLPGKATSESKSSTKSGGSESEQTERQIDAGSKTTVRNDPAGDISKLRLTVTLDANNVTPQQEQAVKEILRTYIDPSRKDPAPVTRRVPFTNGAGADDPSAESTAIAAAAQERQAQQQTGTEVVQPKPEVKRSTSKALLAAMAVVVIGLVTTIVILYRRGAGMAAERARLQEEFSNEQRILDNFAQQSPDEIARELERMLGAAPPSTPQEPALR